MRFNPRASLDTGRLSDRGGQGLGGGRNGLPIPGGIKAGGGAGMVIVILLVLAVNFFGGNGGSGIPGGMLDHGAGTDSSRMADSDRYASCRTGADANDDVDCARVAVENSLYAYWSDLFARSGETFRPATMSTFSGATTTGCGQASHQVGPFYCPADQGIYLDTTFFADVLEGQLGGRGGDFVEPYVLAHEYGHHIQNLLGTMGRVRTQRGASSDAVRLELQADCYAGLWTRAAEGTSDVSGVAIIADLDEGDIAEALDSAKAVGDDRIQKRSGGRVEPEGWTHGSSEQRMQWFTRGYESGDLQACDTFGADRL
ncbi:KPN_02809 family neutral zinc metallopeptidase [Nocardioides jishulii]|uniref:Peptidase n=1 Tax=Nocardioides jishulii TaxID=2575440 RepID=A0A4U2YMW9_9ACTN|nr:neutral zinc metallopeptidase [Nocardioides jishulii]QCX27503.1 peptidase [Nocardioides jishulii]TKI62310.1 peptidase [Nocardioides jishulii]